MKIAIIGSTQYYDKFIEHKEAMEAEGHEVAVPALDDRPELDELGICLHNRTNIGWADRVDIIYDGRSTMTLFDFGMAFMAQKPIKIVFYEPKSVKNVFMQYEKSMDEKTK